MITIRECKLVHVVDDGTLSKKKAQKAALAYVRLHFAFNPGDRMRLDSVADDWGIHKDDRDGRTYWAVQVLVERDVDPDELIAKDDTVEIPVGEVEP